MTHGAVEKPYDLRFVSVMKDTTPNHSSSFENICRGKSPGFGVDLPWPCDVIEVGATKRSPDRCGGEETKIGFKGCGNLAWNLSPKCEGLLAHIILGSNQERPDFCRWL